METILITAKEQGMACLIAGICLIYLVNRRRFNRRGMGGLQHFRNFEIAVITTFLEWIAKNAGVILLLLGAYLLIKGCHA